LRWTGVGNEVFAHIESVGKTTINVANNLLDESSARFLDGQKVTIKRSGSQLEIDIPASQKPMAVISFRRA